MHKFIIPAAVLVVILGGGSAIYANQVKKDDDKMMMEKEGTSTAAMTADEKMAMEKADSDKMMMAKEEQEKMAMTKDAGASFIAFTTEVAARALVKDHGKDVVYFFDASWCPDCQAIQKKLETPAELAKLGKNTVIIKVDYDSATDLKKKYGITHQTFFVRIDASGASTKQAILPTFDQVLTF